MTVEQLEKWLLESPQSCWHGFETWDCLTSSANSIRFSPILWGQAWSAVLQKTYFSVKGLAFAGFEPSSIKWQQKDQVRKVGGVKSQNRQEILTTESLLKSTRPPTTYTHDINSHERCIV